MVLRAVRYLFGGVGLAIAGCSSASESTDSNGGDVPGSVSMPNNTAVTAAVGGGGSVLGAAGRGAALPSSTVSSPRAGAGGSTVPTLTSVKASGAAGSKPVSGSGGVGAANGPSAGTFASASAGGGAIPIRPMGPNTAPGFVNLAPALGEPLDATGTPLSPAAPSGWTWYEIDGAMCRDGSATGFYVHMGTADKLLVYLEGGGACSSPGFCDYNPANVQQVLSGDGQTVAGSIGGATAGRQEPGSTGIFDMARPENPFKDWSQIYIPYCTGDVHFGTRTNVMLPGVPAPQQFVGYRNMQKFIGRIVPTFPAISRVVLTGASAGGFGALLNYSMVQDAFGSALVTVLDDSGPSFPDNPRYMPACLQQNWRTIWGFKDALPSDCEECMQADGGGLGDYGKYLFRKHPNASIGLVSSMQDEVIRLFYSSGLQNCASFTTADPTTITLGQLDETVYMPGADYTAGLTEVRTKYADTGKFASYYLGGANESFHQHIWRERFYDASAGSESIAKWAANLLEGKLEQVGP
jgi:hypothetical protein